MAQLEEQKFLHDLLNVLTVIMAQCEILEANGCKEATLRLQRIHDCGNRIIGLVQERRSTIDNSGRKQPSRIA